MERRRRIPGNRYLSNSKATRYRRRHRAHQFLARRKKDRRKATREARPRAAKRAASHREIEKATPPERRIAGCIKTRETQRIAIGFVPPFLRLLQRNCKISLDAFNDKRGRAPAVNVISPPVNPHTHREHRLIFSLNVALTGAIRCYARNVKAPPRADNLRGGIRASVKQAPQQVSRGDRGSSLIIARR